MKKLKLFLQNHANTKALYHGQIHRKRTSNSRASQERLNEITNSGSFAEANGC